MDHSDEDVNVPSEAEFSGGASDSNEHATEQGTKQKKTKKTKKKSRQAPEMTQEPQSTRIRKHKSSGHKPISLTHFQWHQQNLAKETEKVCRKATKN